MPRKKRRVKRLDDLKKWRIEMLGRFGGFSTRYIASQTFGSALNRVSSGELACVSSCLKRLGVKLRDWRNGITISAQSYAAEMTTPKKVKRYRIAAQKKAG